MPHALTTFVLRFSGRAMVQFSPVMLSVDIRSVVSRLASEEQGQDLVEYALLAATVALTMVVSINFILTQMGSSYTQSVVNVGNQWQTPEPSGS